MGHYKIITNNPLLSDQLPANTPMDFLDGSYEDVLLTTQKALLSGHRLLSHPLSGSIKPNENPYKSVLITASAGSSPDAESLKLIGQALDVYYKFAQNGTAKKDSPWDEDFRLLDFTLIESALKSANL